MSGAKTPLTFDDAFSEGYLKEIYLDRLADAKFIGLDGLSTSRFTKDLDDELALISRKALSGQYKFTRYREKLIVK